MNSTDHEGVENTNTNIAECILRVDGRRRNLIYYLIDSMQGRDMQQK
jgi:hypothetical protein